MADLRVPSIDFSPLARLPQVYREAQMQGNRQRTLAQLGQSGDFNWESAAQGLAASGDLQGAMSLANIGKALRPDVSASGVYGTPIYGQDDKGNTVLGAIGKDGSFRKIDTGGVTPTPGVRYLDTGTGFVPANTKTGQIMGGGIAKDVAGAAEQKEVGSARGEKIAGFAQAQSALGNSTNNLDRLAYEAERIMKDPAVERITGLWSKMPSLPGGAAANLEAKLETLKSQIGFGVLQAMRDASKTGGALGQVSNIENQLLQNNLAALSQAQSAEEFRRAMQQIVQYTRDAKQRLQGAFQQDYESLRKRQSPQQGAGLPAQNGQPRRITGDAAGKAQFDALPSGTQFIAPDGSLRVKP